jgi:Cu+-exporting ATPase
VIDDIAGINHIVFDKTGTLTKGTRTQTEHNEVLSDYERILIFSAVANSNHPYSLALATFCNGSKIIKPSSWKEVPGMGIITEIDGLYIKIGNKELVQAPTVTANVYVRIEDKIIPLVVRPVLREDAGRLVQQLGQKYQLSLLSGDNNRQQALMEDLFGKSAHLKFNQQPMDKLQYIEQLQGRNNRVLMLGDGLNDAGALKQSNVGITLADDINNFTPSCDAILDAKKLSTLPAFIKMAKVAKAIIYASFLVSILYNVVGLFFAIQGKLNPMIAAILMPASTLSIVLVSTGCSAIAAYLLKISSIKEMKL